MFYLLRYFDSSSPLELNSESVIELGVNVDVLLDEGWEKFLEELPGDLLHSFLVHALLKEATFEDIAPPSLHVGGDAFAEADLVSSLCELPVEDVHHVEAVGGDQAYLGVAQLIANIDVVLQIH